MLLAQILIFFELLFTVRTSSDLVAEYTKRLCNNEPTCSFVNHPNIPKDLRTLERRNCLCDNDCREYKDCCIDSMYYKIHEQLPPLMYYCSPNKKVYMKTRCLSEWTDSNMVTKCQKSILPLEDDLSVITPLTNLVTGITYGNVYCAVCNNAFSSENMKDFHTWTLTTRCGKLPDTFTPVPQPPTVSPAQDTINVRDNMPLLVQIPHIVPLDSDFETMLKQIYPSLSAENLPNGGYYLLILLLYYIHPSSATLRVVRHVLPPIAIESDKYRKQLNNVSHHRWNRHKRLTNVDVDFDNYVDEWDAIALNATYDAHSKLWISRYKNGNFVCEYESKLPDDDEAPLRTCVPNVISDCSKFENIVHVHECRLKMAVVYDKRGYAFRNVACALCNGIPEDDTFVCPYDENKVSKYVDDEIR